MTYEANRNVKTQEIINKGNSDWNDLSFTYSYDNMNRLLNTSANLSTYTESFTYDDDGNFLTKNRTGKNLSFQYEGSTNKISTITGTKNYTYSHDTKGNITLKKNTGGSDIYTATDYDHRNLPLTVNGTSYYKYDDAGNRVVKNTSTKNEHYLRDHTGREVAIYNLSTNAIEQVNLFGNGMVGYVEKGTTDKRYYYVKDHLGSVRMVIDEEGDISSARDYYAYGDILREYVIGNEEKYKFTEKERDSETGLDYFGARYFDSEVGGWTSVDPLTHLYPGHSPYNYALNNPLRNIDPDGNSPWDLVANPVFSSSFGKGFISTISNSVTGTWEAVTNPIETGKGIIDAFSNPSETLGAIGDGISQTLSDLSSPDPSVSGEALGNVAAVGVELAVGTKGATKLGSVNKLSKANKTLAANPFKGKSSTQVGNMLSKKGFIQKGSNPAAGKGSFLHPKSGNSYYIDKGGVYKKGTELPHVDVNIPKGTNKTKRKYPLGDKLYE